MSSLELPIAVSMGDPDGVGSDTVLAAVASDTLQLLPKFVCYGNAEQIHRRAERMGMASGAYAGRLSIVDVYPHGAGSGQAAIVSLDCASAAVSQGRARALVTCPINKAEMIAAGWSWSGHTEFLAQAWSPRSMDKTTDGLTPADCRATDHCDAERWTDDATMLFVSGRYRIGLCTIHVPLSQVPKLITQSRVFTHIVRINDALRNEFQVSHPRIGVCGLNPHAGENGTIGCEDHEQIAPAVRQATAMGMLVDGPLPADGVFLGDFSLKYDVALAMYHDQGLVGIKAMCGLNLAQTTLGLSNVRTSPGHGTARELAGTGKADPAGFVAALKLADELSAAQHRNR